MVYFIAFGVELVLQLANAATTSSIINVCFILCILLFIKGLLCISLRKTRGLSLLYFDVKADDATEVPVFQVVGNVQRVFVAVKLHRVCLMLECVVIHRCLVSKSSHSVYI